MADASYITDDWAPNLELQARLEARSIPEPNTGCWLWLDACNDAGYGAVNGRAIGLPTNRANRISYLAFRGPIAEGLYVLHKCDVRSCVNPDHLYLGTDADNKADMVRRARSAKGDRSGARTHPEKIPRGEASAASKLTSSQVAEIRTLPRGYGTGVRIAERFGISQMTVSDIRCGRTWAHLLGDVQ